MVCAALNGTDVSSTNVAIPAFLLTIQGSSLQGAHRRECHLCVSGKRISSEGQLPLGIWVLFFSPTPLFWLPLSPLSFLLHRVCFPSPWSNLSLPFSAWGCGWGAGAVSMHLSKVPDRMSLFLTQRRATVLAGFLSPEVGRSRALIHWMTHTSKCELI